jgi:hypothetical protein
MPRIQPRDSIEISFLGGSGSIGSSCTLVVWPEPPSCGLWRAILRNRPAAGPVASFADIAGGCDSGDAQHMDHSGRLRCWPRPARGIRCSPHRRRCIIEEVGPTRLDDACWICWFTGMHDVDGLRLLPPLSLAFHAGRPCLSHGWPCHGQISSFSRGAQQIGAQSFVSARSVMSSKM